MLQASAMEDVIRLALSLDRPGVMREIRNFRGCFPIDFTSEFLESMSTDRLRHIYVAIVLQDRRGSARNARVAIMPTKGAVPTPVHA